MKALGVDELGLAVVVCLAALAHSTAGSAHSFGSAQWALVGDAVFRPSLAVLVPRAGAGAHCGAVWSREAWAGGAWAAELTLLGRGAAGKGRGEYGAALWVAARPLGCGRRFGADAAGLEGVGVLFAAEDGAPGRVAVVHRAAGDAHETLLATCVAPVELGRRDGVRVRVVHSAQHVLSVELSPCEQQPFVPCIDALVLPTTTTTSSSSSRGMYLGLSASTSEGEGTDEVAISALRVVVAGEGGAAHGATAAAAERLVDAAAVRVQNVARAVQEAADLHIADVLAVGAGAAAALGEAGEQAGRALVASTAAVREAGAALAEQARHVRQDEEATDSTRVAWLLEQERRTRAQLATGIDVTRSALLLAVVALGAACAWLWLRVRAENEHRKLY